MRKWLLLGASSALLCACSSSPNGALFTQQGAATGGANFGSGGLVVGMGGALPLGSGGASGSGGFAASGGYTFGTGGLPPGAGGIIASGGSGGSTLDGSLPNGGSTGTGGFSSGGAGPVDSGGGQTGGAGPADARADAPSEKCRVGHYTGELSGPYTAILGSTTFVADLAFDVVLGGTITGTLTSTSDTTSRATLSGSVDCVTGKTTISIVGGTYRNIRGTTAYQGTMTATFDPGTGSFNDGKWKITEPASTGSGSGTWGATAN